MRKVRRKKEEGRRNRQNACAYVSQAASLSYGGKGAAAALTFYFLIFTSSFVGAADYRESPKVDATGLLQPLDVKDPLMGLPRPFSLRLDTRLNNAQIFENFTQSLAVFKGSIQAGPDSFVQASAGIFEASVTTPDGSGIGKLDARKIFWEGREIVDTDVTPTAADSIIYFTVLTADRTIILPPAASVEGVGWTFKDESGDAVTWRVLLSEAVEGSAVGIDTSYGVLRLYARKGAWHRL